MYNKRLYLDLEEFVNEEITCEIECSKCDKSKASYDDTLDFMKTLFKEGWRATSKNCYCPDCAKKYLKKLNQ